LNQPVQALAQFYHAFNTRDLTLMEMNWDNSDEASMDNPLGGITRGWLEIRQVYDRIFSSLATVWVEFYDYTLHSAGDVFWVFGRERGQLKIDGRTLDLAIRTSRLFRRSSEHWLQIHHQGSMESPALLDAYQQAVK
jgi:hypothetical protein